jgi:hypothetical protein
MKIKRSIAAKEGIWEESKLKFITQNKQENLIVHLNLVLFMYN